MPKMLKVRSRGQQKEIYKALDGIDSYFLNALRGLRSIQNQFEMKRDQYLVSKLLETAEDCANKTLLLKGRIKQYELGFPVFMGEDMLEFHYYKKRVPRNLNYVKLTKSGYTGKKFRNFMIKDYGAMAQVGNLDGKQVIVAIFIPKKHKKLIIKS